MSWATPWRVRLTCLIALALGLVPHAWAQESADPVVISDAEVVVKVADRTTVARDVALRSALDAVVIRLAGERALTDFWVQPNAVLSSYQYRREFDGSADVLKLRVNFDVAALRQALRSAGFSVWDEKRPPVLLWAQAGAGWMDAVQIARDAPELLETSQAWGYTLRLPQLDMSERQRVYASDIRFGSVARWMEVNAEYGMPWALAVGLEPAEAPQPTPLPQQGAVEAGANPEPQEPLQYWKTRWTLADERQILAQFELPPLPLSQATNQAWRQLNGLILEAEIFRRNTAPTQGWTLEFIELADSRQYLRAMSQLRELDIPVRVVALAPESVSLAVEWKGSATDLRRRALQWGWTEMRLAPTPMPTPAYPGGLQTYPAQAVESSRYRFRLPAP